MDAKTLKTYIDQHSTHLRKFDENESYFMGRNPAIFRNLPKDSPDFRVPVAFAKNAVDDITGYMMEPGAVQYYGEAYQDYLLPAFNANEEALITFNLLVNACVQGMAYEIHWFEDGKPNFEPIPTAQGIPVFDNSIRPKLIEFIWARLINDTEYATVYNSTTVQNWELINHTWEMTSEEFHGYGKVPVVIYKIASNGSNAFDHVKDLIDLYDRLISHDVANELERFANAYLLMSEKLNHLPDDDGLTDIDKLKQSRTFEGLEENVTQKVAFLTKNIQSDFIKFSAETVRDLIYEMLQTPNPSDSKSGIPASGFSLVLKNWRFELLCAKIEANFTRGLQDRIRLILGHVLINQPANEVSIKMHRNIPSDMDAIGKFAATVTGIWDLEAILDLFPDSMLTPEAKKRILEAKEYSSIVDKSMFSPMQITEPETENEQEEMEDIDD